MILSMTITIETTDNGGIIRVGSDDFYMISVAEQLTYSGIDRTRLILTECILRGYDSWKKKEVEAEIERQESARTANAQSSSDVTSGDVR